MIQGSIAEVVDIPQILYNVPGRAGGDMLPATTARISRIPDIIGIKEATGNLDRLTEIQALAEPGFLLCSGGGALDAHAWVEVEGVSLGRDGGHPAFPPLRGKGSAAP